MRLQITAMAAARGRKLFAASHSATQTAHTPNGPRMSNPLPGNHQVREGTGHRQPPVIRSLILRKSLAEPADITLGFASDLLDTDERYRSILQRVSLPPPMDSELLNTHSSSSRVPRVRD
jgi:hypothetical protein